MVRRRLRSTTALAFASALAFAGESRAQQPRGALVVAPARPAAIPIARFRDGENGFSQYSGLTDSVRIVIRDSLAWRHYWQLINRPFLPPPSLPDVDFTREIVVLASMGVRPSAGFAIRVEAATIDSTRVIISVRRVVPGSGCAVAAVVTQPVDIVRLPAAATQIWFAERLERSDCGGR